MTGPFYLSRSAICFSLYFLQTADQRSGCYFEYPFSPKLNSICQVSNVWRFGETQLFYNKSGKAVFDSMANEVSKNTEYLLNYLIQIIFFTFRIQTAKLWSTLNAKKAYEPNDLFVYVPLKTTTLRLFCIRNLRRHLPYLHI